jgi:S-adenosyl methyltransferase
MRRLYDALAPGSHLTATHVTTDGKQAEAVAQIEAVYATTPTPIFFRDRADIGAFFDGYELVEPGLVTLDEWHLDPADPAPNATKWLYGAVGRKP